MLRNEPLQAAAAQEEQAAVADGQPVQPAAAHPDAHNGRAASGSLLCDGPVHPVDRLPVEVGGRSLRVFVKRGQQGLHGALAGLRAVRQTADPVADRRKELSPPPLQTIRILLLLPPAKHRQTGGGINAHLPPMPPSSC